MQDPICSLAKGTECNAPRGKSLLDAAPSAFCGTDAGVNAPELLGTKTRCA
jgi:hypothetical protein